MSLGGYSAYVFSEEPVKPINDFSFVTDSSLGDILTTQETLMKMLNGNKREIVPRT